MRTTTHQLCHLNTQENELKKQGKDRPPYINYHMLKSNVRRRKEHIKNAKTAKQNSRNQSKKKNNDDKSTICARENATVEEKTQGKK